MKCDDIFNLIFNDDFFGLHNIRKIRWEKNEFYRRVFSKWRPNAMKKQGFIEKSYPFVLIPAGCGAAVESSAVCCYVRPKSYA